MINKEGFGVFRWASGNVYEGSFKGDERDGHGKMIWTDQSCYEGDWFRGIQHGYGKINFPDGSSKEGYFDNNVFIGKMKEESGNYTPLDPEKIYPVSSKLSKSKSSSKIGLINRQKKERLRIEATIKQNRPQPLIKSKYMSSGSPSSTYLRNSMTQIKSSMVSPLPKASKSARKFFTKRAGLKKRKVLKNKLF